MIFITVKKQIIYLFYFNSGALGVFIQFYTVFSNILYGCVLYTSFDEI